MNLPIYSKTFLNRKFSACLSRLFLAISRNPYNCQWFEYSIFSFVFF